jgi:hypothetical protein
MIARLIAASVIGLVAVVPVPASADQLPEPRKVIAEAVEKLFEAAPLLRNVDVAMVAGRSGHSLCATALTEALLVALDEEARNPNRVLRERPLTVRRVGSGAKAEGETATVSGMLDIDQRGRGFLTLAFHHNGAVVAPTGRVPIALEALACDPAMRPFLQHVAVSARLDREKLDVTAPVFKIGERLEIAITARAPMRLYCWVLAEDGSGYVTLPPGGDAPAVKAGSYRYPRDFRLEEIVLSGHFDNLFACFGAEQPLPESLVDAWRRFATGPGQEATLVGKEAVQALMQEMRAQPGVSEAVARVVVR